MHLQTYCFWIQHPTLVGNSSNWIYGKHDLVIVFTPHPFSSYNHYTRAQIWKIQDTKGKHPSRATTKQQSFYMDFGFLQTSNFDYTHPDNTKARIIQSFDGYNLYLLIIDEVTWFSWELLCKSKEPPMGLVHLHLDIFWSKPGSSIRCNQGGALAHCNDFVSQMAHCKYSAKPTGADIPSQNMSVQK
eukprot:CCRYP_000412-RA/>CCRYP_000412-RA protein AED:0.42 eAED:0.52 QI:0/0/0/1/0/0/2/0/186